MGTHITRRSGPEDGVNHGMSHGISIGVAGKAGAVRDSYTAKDERAGWIEPMGVVPHSYTHVVSPLRPRQKGGHATEAGPLLSREEIHTQPLVKEIPLSVPPANGQRGIVTTEAKGVGQRQ